MIDPVLVVKARAFACELHKHQKRDSGKPYMWHIDKVADLLKLVTDDQEIIAAGYLHDTLEDCETTELELRAMFGNRVTDLVLEVTKQGENCFPRLKTRDAFLIKFADRLQNLSDMVTWNEGRKQRYMNKSIFWLQEAGV
jgi:GTP diphosphokinase / guanosine-3',5'-bis(diphosphate) 3'-diphosphatase